MIYLFLKRIFDIIVSLVFILIFSPVFVIIIIILRFTGEGEVFYLQKRIGKNLKEFQIIKFATMVKDSPNIGTGSITLKNDVRVLPFGRFLRKSKLNEITQVINVLIGNMSIVGPRPQMKVDFIKFPPETRNSIFLSKPGITGIGSIIFRDEENWISNYEGDKHYFYKNKIAPYKTELELWYLNNKSLLVDIILVFCTAHVIAFPKSKLVYKFFKNLPLRPKHLI